MWHYLYSSYLISFLVISFSVAPSFSFFFFLKEPPPTEIYPLPLHAPLPISGRPRVLRRGHGHAVRHVRPLHRDPLPAAPRRRHRDPRRCLSRRIREGHRRRGAAGSGSRWRDRKSTRLNSSHLVISYAVFCLK